MINFARRFRQSFLFSNVDRREVFPMFRSLKGYDFTLFIIPILLSAFGVVVVYSSSMVTAAVEGLGSTYYLKKQFQWFIIGLIFFLLFCKIPYRIYQRFMKPIIFGSIFILGYVLAFGVESNQAIRAISILGILDRKSTRLNSSHVTISYAVFCLKKKTKNKV